MPNIRKPRSGSMQFWPRVRAKRPIARVRSWGNAKEAKPLGFAGYKVGMTHVIATDNRSTSTTKGKDVMMGVTIIECPPLKTASIRFYKNTPKGKTVVGQVYADSIDKEYTRKTIKPKSSKKVEDITDFDDVTLLVYTQPKLTGIGKKKPEVFEIGLGGKKDEKLAYAKEHLGKEIPVSDVFSEGQQLDAHAITSGKGFQGPMKRFGIARSNSKSEKSIRNAGSLGPWVAQGKISYRVPRGGKMGYHQRIEYNKWLLKIGDKPQEIDAKGGFLRYGLVKNTYMLIRGSVGGPSKRLITFTAATRAASRIPKDAPALTHVSTSSPQGN